MTISYETKILFPVHFSRLNLINTRPTAICISNKRIWTTLRYSSLSIQPFLRHSLPYKILPDSFRFSRLRIWKQYFFLQSKIVSLASNPQSEGPGLRDRVAQLYPRHCVVFVFFHDSQGYGGSVSIRLYTGNIAVAVCRNHIIKCKSK
jgi:hypothetical protein